MGGSANSFTRLDNSRLPLSSLSINDIPITLYGNTPFDLKLGRNDISVDTGSIDISNFPPPINGEYILNLPSTQRNIVLNILPDLSGARKVIINVT